MRVESIPARPFHIQQISLPKSTQMLIAELPNLVWLLPRQPEENGVTLAPKSALKCGAVPEESFCFSQTQYLRPRIRQGSRQSQ